MGASSDDSQNQPITGINVTPLVDVILVLLIIFMATAPLIHRRALNVNVPKAAHSEPIATAALQVFLTAQREITLDKTPYSLDEMDQELRRRFRLNPAVHITVAADQSIPYGEVVELLDVVRASGVKKVALEVRTKSPHQR